MAAERAHSGPTVSASTGEAAPPRHAGSGSDRHHARALEYQGLVRALAWKIHCRLPPNVELDDLIAYGQVGLSQAARDFDPARGVSFSTFAYYRVRGAIFDGLAQMSWFSRHAYHARRYERMANEVMAVDAEAGDDVCADLDGGAQWFGGVTGALAVVYLAAEDAESGAGDGLLPDGSEPEPEHDLIGRELRENLHRLIEALPADSGRLIRLCYFDGLTLQDAARELGISKSWASRLHARTLERLARALRSLGMTEEDHALPVEMTDDCD